MAGLRATPGLRVMLAVRAMPGKAETLLTPRSYLAVVEGSPFLEQGLKGARVRLTDSVVLGLMAEGP